MGTLIHSVAHGLLAGDTIKFGNLVGGAGLDTATLYYVLAAGLAADDFAVSLTDGGAAVVFTTNITDGNVVRSEVYIPDPAPVHEPPPTPDTATVPTLTSTLVLDNEGKVLVNLKVTLP